MEAITVAVISAFVALVTLGVQTRNVVNERRERKKAQEIDAAEKRPDQLFKMYGETAAYQERVLKDEIASKEAEIARLKSELAELRTHYQESIDKSDEMMAKIRDLQDKLNKSRLEVERLKQRVSDGQ